MTLRYQSFTGESIASVVEALAGLRIKVFREWPYLYEGDLEYERGYLAGYASQGAIVVGAFDGAQMVGASTGLPLGQHADDFQSAFEGSGLALDQVFYCAESVLLPAYRGRGAGHVFFDHREAFAREKGFHHSAFCAVMRPESHPARPANYAPLDGFWQKRGYAKLDGAIARFSWRDIGEAGASEKPLQFWLKEL